MNGTLYQRTLATQREFTGLCEQARAAYRLDHLPARRFTRSFFDTVDWRLFRGGYVLEFDESTGHIARLRRSGESATFVEEAIASVPRLAVDFPEGPMREQILAAIQERALLPLGGVSLRSTSYRASDDLGKVLLYLEKEQLLEHKGSGRGRTRLATVRLKALRGYEKEGKRLFAIFDEVQGSPSKPPDPFSYCMRLVGRSPGDYSTRLQVQLERELAAGAAMVRILLFLLDLLERNLDGIVADLDTEFLHDFRIACRRSRSLITKVQGVCAGPRYAPFKKEFSWLSQTTSGQRDLDVFLQDLPRYCATLDPELGGHLEPFLELLKAERGTEHTRLVKALQSERFQCFARDWRGLLSGAADPGAEETTANAPVIEVANRSIRRVYDRLLRRAEQAGAGSYSEALHDLRKTGKQLRYLLEAFRSLYPEDDIEGVIAQLRKLQNVLGDIVDYHVQRSYLLVWHEKLIARENTPAGTIMAIEKLAENFDTFENQATGRFLGRFARFAAGENSDRINELFGRAA